MRITVAALLGVVAVNVLLALRQQAPRELLLQVAIGIAAAAVIYVLGLLVGRALERRRAAAGEPATHPSLSTRRAVIVIVLYVLAIVGVTVWLPGLAGRVASEAAHYLCLILLGVVLGRWARTSSVTVATVVMATSVAFVGLQVGLFLADSGAQAEFGAEIRLIAAGHWVSQLSLLPVDVAVALAAWTIAVATQLDRRETTTAGGSSSSRRLT